eukprot:TRINITY_DN40208_c0_g1_i2.p2 TRINITY_DN40208_c0_g1~~TRINITY_DN40208_c0_g1_i2.p2  ORF type:complete len:109 (-),score=12.72 TRINITY_DN40208_c0_g1_i2:210-536(-)
MNRERMNELLMMSATMPASSASSTATIAATSASSAATVSASAAAIPVLTAILLLLLLASLRLFDDFVAELDVLDRVASHVRLGELPELVAVLCIYMPTRKKGAGQKYD